jgi:hypothetical protein
VKVYNTCSWSLLVSTQVCKLLMWSAEQRIQIVTNSETCLLLLKCVDGICWAKAPLIHGIEVVARFKTSNLEQNSHWPIHLSFEWARFTTGKLLQTQWLTITDMALFLVTKMWSTEKIKFGGGFNCLHFQTFLLSVAHAQQQQTTQDTDQLTGHLHSHHI